MFRILSMFTLPLILAVVGVTVAQEKAPQHIAGWGRVVDPKGDCQVVEKEGTLSITVPGIYHDLTPEPGYENMDAPRVLQDVEGDFVMQVLVRKFARPLPNTAANLKKPYSFVSSGLLIWQDDGKFIRLERAMLGGSNFLAAQGSCFSEVKKVASGRSDIRDEDTWLRVERKDGRLSLFHSAGKSWAAIVPKGEGLTLQAKVRVGVFTINGTNREIRHEFEGFSLKPASVGN